MTKIKRQIFFTLFSTIFVTGLMAPHARNATISVTWSGCPEVKEEKAPRTDDVESVAIKAVEAPVLMKDTVRRRPRYNFLLEPDIQFFKSAEVLPKGSWASIVIVKSAYGNRDRRDAIRDTWGSKKTYSNRRFVSVFLLGKPRRGKYIAVEEILAEHEEHRDILLLDIIDMAENVADKSLAGMQWVADVLPDSWIYSSADDDMSLHVPNFVSYIEDTISKRSPNIPGYCVARILNLPIMCIYSYQPNDPPARNPRSKWHMPKERYPPNSWPPYCRGGWYSMPVYLARKLFETSRRMEYLHLDDVWITGLIRIKYAAAYNDETPLTNTLLDAAPLSLRSDGLLSRNINETVSQVIVSHAWGNIKGRKVDVAQTLKKNWQLWTLSFPTSED